MQKNIAITNRVAFSKKYSTDVITDKDFNKWTKLDTIFTRKDLLDITEDDVDVLLVLVDNKKKKPFRVLLEGDILDKFFLHIVRCPEDKFTEKKPNRRLKALIDYFDGIETLCQKHITEIIVNSTPSCFTMLTSYLNTLKVIKRAVGDPTDFFYKCLYTSYLDVTGNVIVAKEPVIRTFVIKRLICLDPTYSASMRARVMLESNLKYQSSTHAHMSIMIVTENADPIPEMLKALQCLDKYHISVVKTLIDHCGIVKVLQQVPVPYNRTSYLVLNEIAESGMLTDHSTIQDILLELTNDLNAIIAHKFFAFLIRQNKFMSDIHLSTITERLIRTNQFALLLEVKNSYNLYITDKLVEISYIVDNDLAEILLEEDVLGECGEQNTNIQRTILKSF